MFCELCGAADQTGKFCGSCGAAVHTVDAQAAETAQAQPVAQPVAVVDPPSGSPVHHYEYMVLTQKDRVFGGKFNPLLVQQALNGLAQQGWRVIEAATTTFPGFSGAREELIFVLERPLLR